MNPQVDAQAADWLARLQREDVSTGERAELERWLENPAHAVAFARTEFAWQRAERLRALPAPESIAPLHRGRRFLSIAAGIVVAVSGAATWYFTAQWNVYATGLGERRTIALSDGSQVSLNTASRMAVEFGNETRIIHLLSGEALFKVAHDSRRPFVVKAENTTVRAVGTAFNVRLRSEIVEVTVTEGKVRFAADSGVETVEDRRRHPPDTESASGMTVTAGSAAVSAAGAVKQVPLTQDALRRRIAWREGVIELKGETLEQAVEEFNRYRKTKLIVADPAIAALRVGGRFETDEAARFVGALKTNFAIRALDGTGGDIYLMGAE